MSKYVKNLVVQEISRRLDGVQDALLANVVGMDANQTVVLRRQLREKNIHLLVVKNGLAKRATEGTPLAAAFDSAEGSLAVVWGAEDFVSLVKEITKLDQGQEFAKFQARGGVMDGEHLTPEKVKEISKWPNRQQQLSILLGQILSPGAKLLSQINAPGGALLSQIDKKAEGAEEGTRAEETLRRRSRAPETAGCRAAACRRVGCRLLAEPSRPPSAGVAGRRRSLTESAESCGSRIAGCIVQTQVVRTGGPCGSGIITRAVASPVKPGWRLS